MEWKEFVYQHVIDYCNKAGSRTFSLRDFLRKKLEVFQEFRPYNKNIEAKIRQQLQFLRNDNLISFIDNSGHYTLRGIDLLRAEIEETKTIDLSKERLKKKNIL